MFRFLRNLLLKLLGAESINQKPAVEQKPTRSSSSMPQKTSVARPKTTSKAKSSTESINDSNAVSNHPFWSEFFRRGIPDHPELDGKKPTGKNMRKIGPGIGNRIQIDVNWTPSVISMRPLSSKPENLRPLLKDRAAFEKEVGVPEKWNEGSESFLGITVLPAPKAEQAGWTTEKQVEEALILYARIKRFLQNQM